jgi:hypothetical protein
LNAYRLPLDTAVMADVERRQFTVAEFARMGEIGIFSEQERVELLAGEVIRMNRVGARHVVVNQLNDLFHRLLGETAIVSMQTPVVLDEDNQPRIPSTAQHKHTRPAAQHDGNRVARARRRLGGPKLLRHPWHRLPEDRSSTGELMRSTLT